MSRVTLMSLLVCVGSAAPAMAQWSTDASVNTPITEYSGEQVQPKIKRAADGTFFLAWLDSRDGNGFYDAYLQRIAADGTEMWAAGGIKIADGTSTSTEDYDLEIDASGNAYLAYSIGGSPHQMEVAKIDTNGGILWKHTFTESASTGNRNCRVVMLSGGGVVVASGLDNNSIEIYRLDPATGASVWSPDRVTLLETSRPYSVNDMQATTDDGFIVSINRRNGTQIFNPRHIYAQKFNSAGVAQWSNDVGLAGRVIWNTNGIQQGYQPAFTAAPGGGAIFAWYESGTQRDAFVRRIDSAGVVGPLLNCSTVPSRLNSTPQISHVPSTDEVFAVWTDNEITGAIDRTISTQRFDAAGNPQWPTSSPGTAIDLEPHAATDNNHAQIVADATGATCFWMDYTGPVTQQLAISRVNLDGTLAWAGSPVIASTNSTAKSRLQAVADGDGWVAAWHEERNGLGTNIYIQRIRADGTLGGAVAAGCQPADIADDAGNPLPSGGSNTGVNEGDYNAFFQGFFDAQPYCDIADDAGNTPPTGTNTGVNEGDYNAFFQNFFNGCP